MYCARAEVSFLPLEVPKVAEMKVELLENKVSSTNPLISSKCLFLFGHGYNWPNDYNGLTRCQRCAVYGRRIQSEDSCSSVGLSPGEGGLWSHSDTVKHFLREPAPRFYVLLRKGQVIDCTTPPARGRFTLERFDRAPKTHRSYSDQREGTVSQ